MESRPVRLGWLSLLLTVIILCLATLSVLSFSTARADLALAQKQARQAQSVYALECAGQQWLAELDAALAQAGDTAELDALLPHGTAREGPGVSAVLEGADGRSLSVFAELTADGGYRVIQWQQSAEWAGEAEAPALFGTLRDGRRRMDVRETLRQAVEMGASDIFIIAGLPLTYKVDGRQRRMEARLMPADTAAVISDIYTLCGRSRSRIEREDMDDDFSFSIPDLGRFRANVLHQRGSLAAVIRVIRFGLPEPEKLNIPPEVLASARLMKGLVLVTGSAGSGKSTTLACLINAINQTREGHIITMEDPIEYIHRHDRCIVTQREISTDSPSYVSALRSALRESPDVILLGEMRDYETIEVAMTAAETGQLLFSTLHTTGAANTVDRIIDVFPAGQQAQVRMQLSMVLQAVISQQLVPTLDGKQTPAFEIMYTNPAIKNLIREAKTHQIDSAIQAGAAQGMCTMDASLLRLVTEKRISKETALTHCMHYEAMEKRLSAMS